MSNDKIDQRIVEMSFENEKFEKGISQSKNSLKEFSRALDNSGLDKDYSGLEKSVTSLSTSFSLLEQIGIGALRRIGESAVDAGAKVIKSLSVDQLTAGWTKYEAKIDAVQTLVSAGYGSDEVEKQMEQLMWFSDETSYNFSDMATNMGKFVSAGVDLQTSSKAMEGIATWAAISGKNSQAASIAMFNLSQAISTGYVDTLNWRSIMGQNMNTVMFKQTAIGVAEAIGAIKKGQVTIQNFDANLKTKWFTNDVLLKTLDQYSNYATKVHEVQQEMNFDTASQAMDYMEQHAEKYGTVLSQVGNAAFKASQESKKFSDSINATMDAVSSGWMRTYEIIFGQLDEAKAHFTALSEILWTVFESGAENRNEMLEWVKELGGISNIFQGIKNAAVAVLTVLLPISKAMDQIFPPRTKEQWLAITESFKEFTASLIITEETAGKIKRTFAGLFAVIDIGWQVLKFLGSAAFEVAKIFLPLGDSFLGASASLGDLLVNIDNAIKSSGVFKYALLGIKVGVALLREGISKVISGIADFVRGLWNAKDPIEYLKNAGSTVFSGLIDGIKMVVSWISGKLTKSVKSISGLFGDVADDSTTSVWSTILKILKEVVEFIGGEAVDGFKNFGDVVENLDFHKIATFVVGGVLLIFVKQLSDLTGAMTGFTNSLTGAINGLTQKFLGTKTTSLIRDMAYAIGVLAASLWVLSRIPADDLNKSLIGLAKAIGIFVVAYGLLQGINVTASKLMNNTKMVSSAFGLAGVAAALLIMTVAIKTISKIDDTQVWNATMVMAAMLGFISGYQVLAALISKIPNQKKVSTNLFGMSAALLAIVGSLALLNLFSINDLEASLAKMAGVLLVIGGIQGMFALAARIGGGSKVSVGVLSLAAGVLAMIAVLKLLSSIDLRSVSQGVGNLALLALIISGVEVMFSIASRIGGGKKVQTNILMLQLGLASMVGLLAVLSMMKPEVIDQGILTLAKMAGIIGAIEITTALSARISDGAKVQKILGSVAITMVAFAGIIALLGAFEQSVIDKGIITLTKMVGLIAVIELVTAAASKIGGGIKLSTSLLGAVAAIVALTGSLALLSMIDQESLRGAVISLTIASVAIATLSFAMDKISAAVNLMSKSSNGFLGKVKNIGLTLIALGVLLVAVAAFFGVLALVLPVIENVSWDGLGKFAVGLVAITALLVVLDRIPMNDTGFVQRIAGLIPGFVAVAAVLIAAVGFFEALNLVLPIVDSVSWDSLGKFSAGLAIVSVLMVAMAALSPVFALVSAIAGEVLAGVLTAIAATALVIMAVVGLAELLNLVIKNGDSLTRGLDLLVEIGAGMGRFIGAFSGGITGGVLEGIGASLAGFVESLSGFSPDSLLGIKALAEAILIITATSIVDGIAGFITGQSSMEAFGTQLAALVTAIKAIPASDASAASDTLAAMVPMASNLKLFAEAAKDIPNSGGFLGEFMGENDIDSFGAMLARFVQVFINIAPEQATHMTDVLAAMVPMATNLKMFANVAQDIPNSGGFLGEFMGENDIDTFGAMLANFVNAFANVATDQAAHSTEVLAAMTPMAANLKSFALAAQEIPNAGGFIGAFLGTVDLSTFSEQVSGLIETFGAIDQTQLSSATTSLQIMTDTMLPALAKFSEFTNGLKASGGFAQLLSGNTTLSEFGAEFRKFVDQLSGIDTSVVAPAMAAMSQVNVSFSTLGSTVIESATKSFENNKVPFQASIATILDEPIQKLELKKKILVDTVSAVFTAVTDRGNSYVSQFKALGGNLIDGLKEGVVEKQAPAIAAMRKVMEELVKNAKAVVDVNSPSKVFETIGGWCTKGLANGLSKETDTAVNAGINMAKATEEGVRDSLGVHSLSTIFSGIGAWLPKSISAGIQNGKDKLAGTAKDLGVDTGNVTVDGVIASVSGGESSLTSGINTLLGLLTAKTAPAAESTGTGIGNSIAKGIGSSLSGSKTVNTVKTALDSLKALIEEGEFYGTITIEEELALYQKLREEAKEGSDERAEIDKEIYTRLKTIYDAQMSYIDGVNKAQSDAADERKKLETDYTKDVADAEADSAKKLADQQKKYDDDVAKAKLDADKKTESEEKSYYSSLNTILENAEKDRQNLREQYAENQKSVNSQLLADIDAQNKAYENAVKSRADAIYSSYNLFDAVDADVTVTGDELLKNLQDQDAALSEWKQALSSLAGRGVGDALIEELQAMGPSSKAQIKALLTLTDDQLTEYVGLFEGKYTLARTKAEEELEGLKDSTAQTIQALNAQAAIDLGTLTTEFNTSMSEINTNMATSMSDLLATHNETLAEINSDLRDSLTELATTWSQSSSDIKAALVDKLNEMKDTYNTSLTKINSDLASNLTEMKTKFATTMKEIAGKTEEELLTMIADNNTSLTKLNTDSQGKLDTVEKTYTTGAKAILTGFSGTLNTIIPNTSNTLGQLSESVRSSLGNTNTIFALAGVNAAVGFATGISNNAYQGVNAAVYLARAAVTAANAILDVHSPSKVFIGIGKFVSMGFANGITAYANQAVNASENMASGTITAVSNALASLEDSDDLSFTITPVLDLSNLKSTDLSQLLTTPVQLGSTSSKIATEAIQNGNKETTPTTTIINKFDLTGLTVRSESDVDAVATKLYQKQQTATRGRGVRSAIRP